MNQIWTIAWKDIYTTFRNRNLLLIMIATPLVIATIVALVFGGGEGGTVTLSGIEVVVVNLDEGADQGDGQIVNNGQTVVDILSGSDGGNAAAGDSAATTCGITVTQTDSDDSGPEVDSANAQVEQTSLADLFDVTELDSEAAAREAVDSGEYVAAVVIPADFSARLAPSFGPGDDDADATTPATVSVYANSGQQISASVVNIVTRGVVDQLMAGNITINATVNAAIETNPAAAQQLGSPEVSAIFGCAFDPALNVVDVTQRPITIDEGDGDGDGGSNLTITSQILVAIGAAQAAFFALFTGQFGVISIIDERRAGTLQRMQIAPIPGWYILAGKLLGTFVTVLFQLVILLVALMLVASLVAGALQVIWGTNVLAIGAVLLALSLAVSGLGVFIAGIARTPEQVGIVGNIVNIVLAVAGGAFGFAVPSPFREISLIYWGTDAFTTLAQGGTDILLNMAVLLAMGAVFFVVGLTLFNRRVNA